MSLKHKHLQPLADSLNRGEKVTFFNGAGTSTNAGIPDFRSPETGLYANLARLKLPYAEAVFDIDYFRENPVPFYTLAQELYPGKFPPTKFHYFLRLLQDKRLLHRVYTQNIDTLERRAGIRDEFIVEAHGSFARNHCIDCEQEMSCEDLLDAMIKSDTLEGIPRCTKCSGLVKPDIVFFGEGLPDRFFLMWEQDRDRVKIAIVAGTSLTVQPFAGLPAELPKTSLRVLANLEVVGDFKRKRKQDIVVKQDCDLFVEDICDMMGWTDELEQLVSIDKNVSHETPLEKDTTETILNLVEDLEELFVRDDDLSSSGGSSKANAVEDSQELFVRDDDLSSSADSFKTASSGEDTGSDNELPSGRDGDDPVLTAAIAGMKLQ